MPKYTVVLLRHEDMGGEPYIAYVDSESGSKALEYCVTQVGELATVPGIASALASTPKQPLAEYRNKVIEDCSITIENCEPDEHGRLSIQEIAEAVSAMKEQP